MVLSGISSPFGELFRASRADYPRVTHPCAALLTLAGFLARLACVRHAASVRSEPGSNSPIKRFRSCLPLPLRDAELAWCMRSVCKLKECGSAFLRRLAIQFSKTEPLLKSGASLGSSLELPRTVPKTTGSRQAGRRSSHRRSASQEAERLRLDCLRREELISNRPASARQARRPFRSALRAKGRCFYPLAGHPSEPRAASFSCVRRGLLLVPLAASVDAGSGTPTVRNGFLVPGRARF